jgi:multiple sugar transport system permease protein/alpha-1,4-digalacturonate transport system permease protein
MISTLLIPIQVIEVPEFIVAQNLGLINSWWGVILPRSAEAFGLLLVRQFMVGIPDELLESARLDGAGELTVFRKVVLPLSGPAIAVLTVLTFVWRWNDFAWPIVVLQQHSSYTIPLGLQLMQGQFATDWNGIMSMALLSILPVLIIFAFFQRRFVQGIANTGMK